MSLEHPSTASISSTFYLGESEAVSVDSSAGGLLEGMGLDGDTLAPMETDEPTATDPKAKSKLTPAMATRIKQIKPLLSGEKISVSILTYMFLIVYCLILTSLCLSSFLSIGSGSG